MRRRRAERTEQYASPTYLEIQERIARNARRLRERHEWTQEDAAHKSGLSTRLYQRVEAGDSNLTLTTLARLCEGFAVDISELFRRKRRGPRSR
jgi:transcriptional regulator with XRE-family HTH domain